MNICFPIFSLLTFINLSIHTYIRIFVYLLIYLSFLLLHFCCVLPHANPQLFHYLSINLTIYYLYIYLFRLVYLPIYLCIYLSLSILVMSDLIITLLHKFHICIHTHIYTHPRRMYCGLLYK